MIISESFQIIICHRSNIILECFSFFFCLFVSCYLFYTFSMFLFVCILLFVLHLFNVFFLGVCLYFIVNFFNESDFS